MITTSRRGENSILPCIDLQLQVPYYVIHGTHVEQRSRSIIRCQFRPFFNKAVKEVFPYSRLFYTAPTTSDVDYKPQRTGREGTIP